MLRAFGMQNYAELADYVESKYQNIRSAFGDIKTECDVKGMKLDYTS